MKRALALFVGLGDNDQMESESDAFFFRNDKHTRGYSVIDSIYTSRELESRHVLSMFTKTATLRFCVQDVPHPQDSFSFV